MPDEAPPWQQALDHIAPGIESVDYRFLGASKGPEGQPVYTFGHRVSGRKIHVDDAGTTYSMRPTMGVPDFEIISKVDALNFARDVR